MKNVTIRASNGTRFELLKDKILEKSGCYWLWFLSRKELADILQKKPLMVQVHLLDRTTKEDVVIPLSSDEDWKYCFGSGMTQRRKLFFEIGCIRFVGKERQKLIRWAKTGDKL